MVWNVAEKDQKYDRLVLRNWVPGTCVWRNTREEEEEIDQFKVETFMILRWAQMSLALFYDIQVLSSTYKSRHDEFKRIFKDVPKSERLIVGE